MNESGEQARPNSATAANEFWNSATGYNYLSPYEVRPAPTDWLSSPDWPVDKPEGACATSPDSTPVFYTSANGDFWNYIDANFKQVIQPSSLTSPEAKVYENSMSTYPQTIPQSNGNPNWGQGNSQTANISYFPVSPIHDPPAQIEDEEADLAEGQVYPDSSLSTQTGESSQSPSKAAWGSSKESQQRSGSYKLAKRSSRIKEKERQNSRRKSSSSSAKGQWQLRGTKTGPKIDSWDKNDVAGTDSTECSRVSHNMIEKKYRTRLNGQFSTLLDALPPAVTGTEINGDGGHDSGGTERKVTKAEVLVLAKTHIQTLERAKMTLESDKKALQEDVQRLKAAWVNVGGQVKR